MFVIQGCIIDLLSFFAQVGIGIATLALSIVIFRANRQRNRLETMRSVQQSWSRLNEALLLDQESLTIAQNLFSKEDLSDENTKKKFILHNIFNIVETSYLGCKYGFTDESYFTQFVDSVLIPVCTNNPEAIDIIQNHGYHPEFVNYALQVVRENAN